MAATGSATAPEAALSSARTSFAQQRLWFLEQYEPDTALYNIPTGWRLRGALDRAALARALQEIVNRHEVLRTTFVLVGSEPQQLILPQMILELPMIDLSSADDPEQSLARLMDDEASRRFDLMHGPLIRAGLIRLGATDHALLLTVHHIVSDGWSTGVLLRELGVLYDAFATNQPSSLPDLAIQYADFAEWQREWLQGAALEEQLDYWRHALADAPPALEMPTDRPRPAVVTYRGATVQIDLSADLGAALRTLGERMQVSMFMLLAAAFNVLLHRWSGQDDICIGYPVANRNRAEIEPLIGFFVNTLVLRTRFTPDQTFAELLRQVRESVLDADAYQDLPFEKLVEDLCPARNPARSPLFQVMFALDNLGGAGLRLAQLDIQPIARQGDVAKFELTLGVAQRDDSLIATFGYNTDLFDHATIARMAGHYRTLLAAVIAAPATPIADLPLLDDAERHRILFDWNETAADFPEECCIHQLFEAQVARTPDAVALVYEEQQLTYGELNARANRFARHLCALGASADSLIPICAERSLEMVVGLLAILKAGAAYVPLDPGWPLERHRALLRRLASPIAISTQAQLQRMRDAAPPSLRDICLLDGDDGQGRPAEDDNPNVPVSPLQRAYIIFTSGSTGEPKGVVLTHRPVVNLIAWVNRHMQVSAADRLLFVTSPTFDLSVYDIFGTLAAGATVDIAPQHMLDDPMDFASYLRDRRVTFWDSAPAALHYLTQFLKEAPDSAVARSLRVVFLSGDWIPLAMPARVRALFPQARLIALGGATEAAIWSNAFAVGEVAPHWRSIPYGRPIQNARYYILDRHLAPVPVGVTGDLYIGGMCLASGYFADPVQTAASFLPDPYSAHAGSRMYRTGDMARFLSDGTIEFLGRCDAQVKVRGFRIELGEIECVLARFPDVREAVVAARQDDGPDRILVAYIVSAAGTPPLAASDLRARLLEQLPDYMVPSAFVFLDALPMSANGKVDRKHLPAPDARRDRGGRDYVAPRTPAETLLATIWAEVLGVERVGIRDNFFELGGYSLMIVQVVTLLRNRHGCEIAVRDLFGTQDLEELAQRLEKKALRLTASIARAAPFVPVGTAGVRAPETYLTGRRVADEVLWNARNVDPRMAWFQYQFAVHIHGGADAMTIQQAVRMVVERHPIIAGRFSIDGDLVHIHEGEFDDLAFERLNPVITDQQDPLQVARGMLVSTERRPFDRLAGPLCRFTLISLNQSGSVLLVQIDHALFDLQSQDVFLADLAEALRALRSGDAPAFDARVPRYSDYCRWHRAVLTDERWASLQDYWRRQFAEPLPPQAALFGQPQRDAAVERWQHHAWILEARDSNRVNAICARLGATPLVLFMAFFRRWAVEQRQVAVFELETDVLGRIDPAFNRTIGFFSTNLVLRFVTAPEMPLTRLIEDTAGQFADGLAHQELPFFALKQIANPALSPDNYHWPIKFSQQTSVLDDHAHAAAAREFSPVQLGMPGGRAHPLCIYLTGTKREWKMDFFFDADIVARETVDSLAKTWEQLLHALE